ncbi:MAG: ABC transporter permease [Rhizobiales bacterium]|nr:ABC transporter permease [Hyphomicrobiales bacterium]
MKRDYIPMLLENLIWFILVAVFLFFALQSKFFLTSVNITNILSAAAVLGILVVGQTFVLITGNFDLSSESTLGLSALFGIWLIVPAMAPNWGGGILLNPYLSICIILLMGGLIGWIIGLLITIGKMNNFIVTLAMLLILRGTMLAFTAGNATSGLNFPPADIFYWLGHAAAIDIPGIIKIPVAVIATALVFIIGHIVLNHRGFGRELYAIGGNRAAAIASGIDADKRVRQVYVISGMLAAFGGWMLAGRVASIQVNLGEGYIFTVMAAAVIGGVSLQGGRGTMIGALGGVLLLSTIDRGLNLMKVSVFWIKVIQGLIIMLAMFIDAQRVRYRARSTGAAQTEAAAAEASKN